MSRTGPRSYERSVWYPALAGCWLAPESSLSVSDPLSNPLLGVTAGGLAGLRDALSQSQIAGGAVLMG
jgi:hypothetical protein